jgi:hypothetical protein
MLLKKSLNKLKSRKLSEYELMHEEMNELDLDSTTDLTYVHS